MFFLYFFSLNISLSDTKASIACIHVCIETLQVSFDLKTNLFANGSPTWFFGQYYAEFSVARTNATQSPTLTPICFYLLFHFFTTFIQSLKSVHFYM